MSREPLVLVHGAFHGAWCWSEVVLELAVLGRPAVAVDLPGHGLRARRPTALLHNPFDPKAFATEFSPLAHVNVATAADALAREVRRVGRGTPVTLVAHSMGGPVITRVAEQHPGLVERVVYVSGYMPASGVAPLAYLECPEAADSLVGKLVVADPSLIGALRIDTRAGDSPARQTLREAFYGDVSTEAADAAIALLCCDGPIGLAAQTTRLTAGGWGSVPRTYVRCTQDRSNPPALQDLFIAEADRAFPENRTAVATLLSGHSPFLSMPRMLAETLCGL
ncbi:alpha/beta fold hydrolase [Streptomyces sp. S.PB5]|uniref:alpha/beta fold hydrolase n=1 Tax=Streptomyces sp. S.PB5 TaxID=3020844 RepID=UPI0025B153E0|nr:alpha/beta fold hydrolase [Streptomyces sp. S.PB5]MDN3028545.1 alpha/beta fold hydrolase [Streptomyces sp. S.PB5]